MYNLKGPIRILLATLLVAGVIGMANTGPDLTTMLPDDVDGWTVSADDKEYDRHTLFEYINGGAELYLSYGFQRVVSRKYSRPYQPDIVADIFDMGTSENAFGVFSHSREIVDHTFGQGSQHTSGLLLFWKNNHYVSILASPETAESKDAVFSLARHIETAIPTEGPIPAILNLLPTDGLAEESVRYFHHYVWLNSHYFVASENILHIDENTDAVLAKYGKGDTRHILLVVEYPDDEHARRANDDFVKHYLPELADQDAVRIEDGTWTGRRKAGTVMAVVFNAETRDIAMDMMEAVQKRISAGRPDSRPSNTQ
ncbi:MAG: hypothetical protein JSW58_06730 [Candidatus Latescibacterota bacterium]|nr:MAG: hypothetical protein JSW58_06730 [Candidatus Latescibacterota bacterium]